MIIRMVVRNMCGGSVQQDTPGLVKLVQNFATVTIVRIVVGNVLFLE